jgi:hypothetical protein
MKKVVSGGGGFKRKKHGPGVESGAAMVVTVL